MNAQGSKTAASPRAQQGMTLLELMIAVAIIAIVAAIAWPTWTGYITRTQRTAAAGCLLEQAQFMERFYTQNMSYATDRDGGAVSLPASSCTQDQKEDYTFALSEVDDTSFLIEATPIGTQASRDTECGTLSLDQTGAKTISGTGDATRCMP